MSQETDAHIFDYYEGLPILEAYTEVLWKNIFAMPGIYQASVTWDPADKSLPDSLLRTLTVYLGLSWVMQNILLISNFPFCHRKKKHPKVPGVTTWMFQGDHDSSYHI